MPVRKTHSPAFKAKVALAALAGDKTTAQLCAEFGVHQTMINKCKKQLLDSAPGIFSKKPEASAKDHEKELHELGEHYTHSPTSSGCRSDPVTKAKACFTVVGELCHAGWPPVF